MGNNSFREGLKPSHNTFAVECRWTSDVETERYFDDVHFFLKYKVFLPNTLKKNFNHSL